MPTTAARLQRCNAPLPLLLPPLAAAPAAAVPTPPDRRRCSCSFAQDDHQKHASATPGAPLWRSFQR